MKRYFSLILALLMCVFGFGFSDKTSESRAALLNAQPIIAELTAAAAPAHIIETVELEEIVEEIAPEEEKPEEPPKYINGKGYLWPTDIEAEIMAGYPSYSNGSAHWGVDIGLYDEMGVNISEGTPIYATRDGVVITAYNDDRWNDGFGNHCIIDHGDGVQTLYAHSRNIFVEEGDCVEQGQLIGIVGDTGFTTAPHLHFEVRVDSGRDGYKRANPLKFISEP